MHLGYPAPIYSEVLAFEDRGTLGASRRNFLAALLASKPQRAKVLERLVSARSRYEMRMMRYYFMLWSMSAPGPRLSFFSLNICATLVLVDMVGNLPLSVGSTADWFQGLTRFCPSRG